MRVLTALTTTVVSLVTIWTDAVVGTITPSSVVASQSITTIHRSGPIGGGSGHVSRRSGTIGGGSGPIGGGSGHVSRSGPIGGGSGPIGG